MFLVSAALTGQFPTILHSTSLTKSYFLSAVTGHVIALYVAMYFRCCLLNFRLFWAVATILNKFGSYVAVLTCFALRNVVVWCVTSACVKLLPISSRYDVGSDVTQRKPVWLVGGFDGWSWWSRKLKHIVCLSLSMYGCIGLCCTLWKPF